MKILTLTWNPTPRVFERSEFNQMISHNVYPFAFSMTIYPSGLQVIHILCISLSTLHLHSNYLPLIKTSTLKDPLPIIDSRNIHNEHKDPTGY